jgi:hypothetical protein
MSQSTSEPGPLTTNMAAVILGASAWPEHPNLTPSEAFLKSAERFRSYLLDANGLGYAKIIFSGSSTISERLMQSIGRSETS